MLHDLCPKLSAIVCTGPPRLYMTVRSMATTDCTVEPLEVPRKMTAKNQG